MTGVPISTDWKGKSYYFILIMVDWLTKIGHYKPIKITINAPALAVVILDMVVWYYSLPDLIISDRNLFFTSKL